MTTLHAQRDSFSNVLGQSDIFTNPLDNDMTKGKVIRNSAKIPMLLRANLTMLDFMHQIFSFDTSFDKSQTIKIVLDDFRKILNVYLGCLSENIPFDEDGNDESHFFVLIDRLSMQKKLHVPDEHPLSEA